MDSVQHPPLSHLLCPYSRYKNSSMYVDLITIIDISYYLPYYRYSGHHLYPLYWCNNKESGEESLCHACTFKGIGTTYYFCHECYVSYHKECVESPPLLKSLYHPKHRLQLVHDQLGISCSYCDASGSRYKDVRLYYYCFTCKFGLHPVCATRPSLLNYPKRHEHDLNIFPRKSSFTCDICGIFGSKSLFFVCLQCDFVVHTNCIYLPFVIRISRHDHRLSFAYSISSILSCGVCRQKVDSNYGNYSCMKDCSYAVHSKCATRKDVWDGKELEEEPEDDYKNMNYFEVIGDGIIHHFSHSHHMKFERKTTDNLYDDDQKRCQACLLPFYGGGIYKCIKSKCDFILHEACANLPGKKQHMAHPYPFILQVSDTKNSFFCGYCDRFSYGFRYVYNEGGESISIDLQCAAVSEPFNQQFHSHPLFLSNELGKYRPCSICGKKKLRTLNCIECNFFLCFYCATLPYKVRYEDDEHFLTLSYQENARLNWCEVCEETLDSNKWIYTCNEYGAAIHITCVLGSCALSVTPAQNILLYGYTINIIPNNGLTRPICDYCGSRCQDKLMLEVVDDDDDDDSSADDSAADDDCDVKRLICYRHLEERRVNRGDWKEY